MHSLLLVVVKWSAYSPSTLTIQVRIPMTPSIFFCKICVWKERNKKEAGVGPFLKLQRQYSNQRPKKRKYHRRPRSHRRWRHGPKWENFFDKSSVSLRISFLNEDVQRSATFTPGWGQRYKTFLLYVAYFTEDWKKFCGVLCHSTQRCLKVC